MNRAAAAAPEATALASHALQPLLAPRSIAVVGASAREGSFGHTAISELIANGCTANLMPVNPGYEQVQGLACHPDLASLPETPDHAVLCVANARLEAAIGEAARAGVRAATIFASGVLPGDPPGRGLAARVRDIAREAGMRICGGNCMGFRNLDARVHVGVFRGTPGLAHGPVAFISHSGTAYGIMSDLDGRVGFNLMVSAGQELTTSAADYLDYALAMPGTRCVTIFMEAIRDPAAFVAALARAEAQGVPVVVLKVGRTARAARFAISHSGAIVGDDGAYQALFDRHGVIRVQTLDEMVNAVQLLCCGRPLAPGGLAVMLDSGGKRELLVDLAEDTGVPLAEISDRTRAAIAANLDPGLEAVNPLDYWGTAVDWQRRFVGNLAALAEDPDSAMVVLASVISWSGTTESADFIIEAAARTTKPVGVLSEFLRRADIEAMHALKLASCPVLVGEQSGLRAIRAVISYRDFLARGPEPAPPPAPQEVVERWRARLRADPHPDEHTAMTLLADFGIATAPSTTVASADEAVAAADALGYPVVLKTAAAGVHHKSDVDGVRLDLASPRAVAAAHADLAGRLGPRALVARQVQGPGVELALGAVRDPVAGTLVLVAAGGTLVEVLDDKACAIAPINADQAHRLADRLRIRKLLDPVRGRAACDVEALVESIVRFSVLAATLADVIAEIDVNPVLVTAQGCTALDALVVGSA